MALLEVRDLTVRLATARGLAPAVRHLSLEIDRGETLGLVGESGCGKSITALSLIGLLPERAEVTGEIRFEGRDLARLSEDELCKVRGNRIAMVFQEPMTSLNPLHTIGRQVAEPLVLHKGLGTRAARERALDLLDRVGLPNPSARLDQYPHQLSGGQRQRVMIAMALACDPDLLIADEPTTALDVTIQGQILDLILDLVEERRMALLLISHDLGVIAQTTRRMVVMYGGIAAEEGPTAAVFSRLAHPYARGLFAARPSLAGGRDAPLSTIPGVVPELADLPRGCPFMERCPLAIPPCGDKVPDPVLLGEGHSARCIRAGEA